MYRAWFSGAFAKLRKSTISFVLSVCQPAVCLCVCLYVLPYVRMEQIGSQRTDFHEIWYWSVFRKSVEKIQVSLNLTITTATLHEDQRKFLIISRSFLPVMGHALDKSCRENRNMHFCIQWLFFFLRKSCLLWDNVENVVQPDRPQMTVRRMRIACWITKATNTHAEYVVHTAFPLQPWWHEFASLLRCTYIASLCFTFVI